MRILPAPPWSPRRRCSQSECHGLQPWTGPERGEAVNKIVWQLRAETLAQRSTSQHTPVPWRLWTAGVRPCCWYPRCAGCYQRRAARGSNDPTQGWSQAAPVCCFLPWLCRVPVPAGSRIYTRDWCALMDTMHPTTARWAVQFFSWAVQFCLRICWLLLYASAAQVEFGHALCSLWPPLRCRSVV